MEHTFSGLVNSIRKDCPFMKRTALSGFVCLLAVLSLTACDRATGGGRLDGVNGRASFGFTADGCNIPDFKGQVQFVDHDNDVKFHGDVVYARQCIVAEDCPVCDPLRIALGYPLTFGDYEVEIQYRSTNPADPGSGTARACFTDNGEGVNSTGSDSSIVQVESGPYFGYLNHGTVRGNVQQHACK
jgi:hypothetical protein